MNAFNCNTGYKPAGRIMLRKTGAGEVGLVGALRFDHRFAIKEGFGYLAHFGSEGCEVFDSAVGDQVPSDVLPYHIDYHLREPIWPRSTDPKSMMVRFIQQWPGSNIWVVYGAVDRSPVPEHLYSSTGHAWFDLRAGVLNPISAPAVEAGLTISQLGSTLPVWPGPQDEPYALCCIQSGWRPDYLEYNRLQVSLGRGQLTRAEFKTRVLGDDRLCHLISNPGDDYLRYLVSLDDLGGVEQPGPQSEKHLREREDLAAVALRNSQTA